MKEKKYHGVVVPMVSPLREDGTVDTEAVEKIVGAFAGSAVSPLVLGTTGESVSLGGAESRALVSAAVAAKSGTQYLYAGLTGTSVAGQIRRANEYFALGADVVVATLPSYYVLTASQMSDYYRTLADNISGPLMIYNIPSTTHMSVPLEEIETLSRHGNICGLKDSERDAGRLKACIEAFRDRDDFSFFCGWGAESARSLAWGADGIVPSTGNLVPELYRQLYQAARRKEDDIARQIQEETDAIAALYQRGRTLGQSLAALKEMMAVAGWCKPYMKPPLTRLDQEERETIRSRTKEHLIRIV